MHASLGSENPVAGGLPGTIALRAAAVAAVAGFLLALSGCSSGNDNSNDPNAVLGIGGNGQFPPGAGGGYYPGAGGAVYNPNAGGAQIVPGAGGAYVPGAGGFVNQGAGGYVGPGAGGFFNPGAGGDLNPGAGGALNPGAGGAPAGVPLKPNCIPNDLPNEPACSSYNTPAAGGGSIITELGPYGAVAQKNRGAGFEVVPNALDTAAFCTGFAGTFGEDPTLTADVLNLRDTNLRLHSVFRPANMAPGEKFPVITWGNGTCAQPGAYAALLMHVASHGFFVVAPNSRFVAGGAQSVALDFIFAANADPASEYYGRIDTTKVGAMGHSQGSAATAGVATSDARIQYVILFNGGTTASKPFMSVSGDRDIGNPTVASLRNGVNAAPKAAFMFFHRVPQTGGSLTGHLTLMMEPNRVTEATTGWWQMNLKGDAVARELFVGSCGLCGHDADFEYGQKGL